MCCGIKDNQNGSALQTALDSNVRADELYLYGY